MALMINFSTPQAVAAATFASPAMALVVWLHLVTMDPIEWH